MINTNRDFISLEEALAYLRFINREQPFQKEELQIPTKDFEDITTNSLSRPVEQKQAKKHVEQAQDADYKKTINKNRAIKRIIQSSFQILQKFNNSEQDEEGAKEKSASVQFNIYLKQHNRVLELIYNKETETEAKETIMAEEREDLLQNIYEFTVEEDFRQVLPVATLKDKVSKKNIDLMVENLHDSLVMLRANELRIYESRSDTSSFRGIKLHQIENVDYHNQPYIFLVLTIQKDKERTNIYIKFESQKNQDKWDRALYCCYMSRKMKTKDKLFCIQYPEEDVKKKEEEEIKRIAQFHHQPSKEHVVDRLFNQKTSEHSQREDLSDKGSNPPYNKSTTKKETADKGSINLRKTTTHHEGGSQANKDYPSQHQMFESTVEKGKGNVENGLGRTPNEGEIMGRIRTDIGVTNKPDTRINQNVFSTQRQKIEDIFQQQEHPSRQESVEPVEKSVMLPRQVREVHQLERKYAKGVTFKKEKLFFDKEKLVYLRQNPLESNTKRSEDLKAQLDSLKERELEYWDYDSNTGAKSERKVIPLLNISQVRSDQQKGSLTIRHGNKEIAFIGDQARLGQIKRWIELIQKICTQEFD